MDEIVAVEQRRPIRESAVERLARETGGFVVSFIRLGMLVGMLTPALLVAFVTLDVPVRRFDQLFDTLALKPSNWLSVGGLILTACAFLVVLFSRRFGGDEASRAVTAAWGVAAVATFAGLSYLAPALHQGDFPSVRFVIAFVASAMAGQYVAIAVYDVVRGGGAWWRAPFLAALFGFGVQVVVYYPWVFWSTSAPWAHWLIADFAVKMLAAFAFLPVYRLMQKSVRPARGLGGR